MGIIFIPDCQTVVFFSHSLKTCLPKVGVRELRHWDDYYEFEGMSSRDSFNLMVFADTVDNSRLQERLINALNKTKPFRNFKWQIDNSGEYRQKWFDFKAIRYVQWVKEQIEDHNRANEIKNDLKKDVK